MLESQFVSPSMPETAVPIILIDRSPRDFPFQFTFVPLREADCAERRFPVN